MNIIEAFPPKHRACAIATSGEAAQIARALKARQTSKGWVAKCPAHDDRNASLSISEQDDRLLLHCFAGCEFNDILGILQDRGIIGDDRPDRARRTVAPYIKPVPTEHTPDDRAMQFWRDSGPLQGTLGQIYLERRGNLIMPPSLRYNVSSRAMIAVLQRPDGKPVAVQATFLTKDGEKVAGRPARLTYGEMRDGAVRLAGAAEVMGLAEGTETGLSAMEMSGVPVWVSLGSERLDRVILPELVREVHIFGDNDAPGRAAAQRTADVHRSAGRRVVFRFPPDGISDFNDLVRDIADVDGDSDRLMANLQVATVAPKIGRVA